MIVPEWKKSYVHLALNKLIVLANYIRNAIRVNNADKLLRRQETEMLLHQLNTCIALIIHTVKRPTTAKSTSTILNTLLLRREHLSSLVEGLTLNHPFMNS